MRPPSDRVLHLLWIASFVLIGLMISGSYFFGRTLVRNLRVFEQYAQRPVGSIISDARKGWEYKELPTKISFLLVGLDEVPERKLEQGLLTDALLFTRVNLEQNTVSILSIPRDLWIAEYKSKINSLYYYGIEQNLSPPTLYLESAVAKVTGYEIDYIVPVRLAEVATLVEILGGLHIEVARSFVDTRFPRENVDVSVEKDPSLLYKTVQFDAGPQTMTAEDVLAYMRSRNSEDELEGNDQARSLRQKRVIESLVIQLLDPSTLKNPELLGRLYRFYDEKYRELIPLETLIAWGRSWLGFEHLAAPTLRTVTIPVRNGSVLATPSGLLVNPPISIYNQWVYEPIDSSYQELQEYIKSQMP